MINKCKVQIRMRELYNVIESPKERDEKKCIWHSRNKNLLLDIHSGVFVPAIILSMHQTD